MRVAIILSLLLVFIFAILSTMGANGASQKKQAIKLYSAKQIDYANKWNYIYSYAIIMQPEWLATIITDEVLKNCVKYNIDPYLEARKIWKETKYRVMAVSKLTYKSMVSNELVLIEEDCAFGITQIHYNVWKPVILRYLSEKEGRKITSDDEAKKLLMRISYNVELGCMILRHYLNMFKENYSLALTAYYAGENSIELIKLKNKGISNEYIEIVDENHYHEKMKLWNSMWVVTEKRSPETFTNI